jgi:ABC-type uncharacterized transport system involved in gliding motility auxiliary subunit
MKRAFARSSGGALVSGAALGLLGLCVALLWLVSSFFYVRLDFSEGGLYSLSRGSRRILKGLDSPVEIRAYFSKELPPDYASLRAYTLDLLREYRDASRGKVRFSFPDMEKDGPREAARQGILPVQFNVVSRDKLEVREGYMGLVLQREDRKEVIPVLADSKSLEYDVTSRIVRLAGGPRKVIGLAGGGGAAGKEDLPPEVSEMVERNYELREVELSELAAAPTAHADLASLFLLGPSEKLGDEALYALDQFLLSGRPLVAASGERKVDLGSFFASGTDTGLRGLLEHHGVRVRDNLVLDLRSQKVSVAQRAGWLLIRNLIDYPALPVAGDLGKDHPVTRDLGALTLPFCSPLELSTRTASGQARVLARSSKGSWLREAWEGKPYLNLDPVRADFTPAAGDPGGPFVLAAELEDRFTSYFSTVAARALPRKADPARFRESGKGRLVVIGTSLFADRRLGGRDPSGQVFLANLMEWSAMDSDLISIRAKRAVFRPLREVSVAVKRLVRWANILLPPLLVALAGVLRYWLARRARSARAGLYGKEAADA